jgi:lysyl-tRNA synthetase class II
MMDEAARNRFKARSKAVSSIRDFMVAHGFLEVETPMLHPIPGGANAKPFTPTTTRWSRRCSCACARAVPQAAGRRRL